MNFEQTITAIKLLFQPYMSEMGAALGCIIGVAAVPVLLFLLFSLVRYVHRFSNELRYLNDEIRRTDGGERMYYIHCRRRLWLSLIPFVPYKNE